MAYVWRMKEGVFVVGHADAIQSLEDPALAAQFFNGLREEVKKLAAANNGQVGV